MLRLLCLIVCLILSVYPAAGELEEYLERYEGRWSGDFTIHSTASDYTENFPVEQRYWLEGKRLRGIAVLQRQKGIKTSTSWTYIGGKKLVSEVTRGDGEETDYGVPQDQGILWISSDLNRAEDYQLIERIVEEEGQRRLRTEGFDTYLYAEGLAISFIVGSSFGRGLRPLMSSNDRLVVRAVHFSISEASPVRTAGSSSALSSHA